MKIVLIFIFRLLLSSEGGQIYNPSRYKGWETSRDVPHRLLELMKSMYHDVSQRITETNPQRFMYEASPYYEQGYVFGEIIERYKRMVMQIKRMEHPQNLLYDVIDKAEQCQKLYFEIHHLVKMMHEVPRKYRNDPEYISDKPPTEEEKDHEDYLEYQKIEDEYKDDEEWRQEVIANRMKAMKHRQRLISKGIVTGKQYDAPPGSKPNQTASKEDEDLDYGWDP